MCQENQLCARLKVGIDGDVHGIQAIWDANLSMKNCSFLLVKAKKAFKKTNHIGILWVVRHLWPPRDHFVLNFYCHWSLLVLQNENGTAIFVHSVREGVIKGYPLDMVTYGIDVLPMIQ